MSRFYSSPSSSGFLVTKLAHRRVLPLLYPTEFSVNERGRDGRRRRGTKKLQMKSNSTGLEAWFIKSLANAGSCRKHASEAVRTPLLSASCRLSVWSRPQQIRKLSTCRAQQSNTVHATLSKIDTPENEDVQAVGRPLETLRTKEELLALVDQYEGESYKDRLPYIPRPGLYQPSDGPHLAVSDKVEDEWPPVETPNYTWPADPETTSKIKDLVAALKDIRKDHEEVYQLYRALPAPRVPYLRSKVRHRLLHHLAVVEKKDESSMLRYLSVVDDLKTSAIPLTSNEWASAMSFVARYVSRPGPTEVEAALETWKEMEQRAGVESTGSHFNILFNVACKAGKFTLADMIFREMEGRRLEATCYHHVSIIYYHGLKRNGDGAREAYKNMIDAGEVVNTVVLNAMISALIRAQEPSAAENIYERMKLAHLSDIDSKLSPTDFHSRRSANKALLLMTTMTKGDREKREELQRQTTMTPNMITFKILINYYAVQSGEMSKAAKVLDEMKWFALPLHGAMFLALFKGFAIHGGLRYTEWTDARLERVWASFMLAVREAEDGIYVSKWMASWALKAFAKCAGRERMLAVWEEIRTVWGPDEMELEFVLATVRELVEMEKVVIRADDEWLLRTTV